MHTYTHTDAKRERGNRLGGDPVTKGELDGVA